MKGTANIIAGAVFLFGATTTASADFWTAHIAPIAREHCTKCHGGAKRKGGLDLRSQTAALQGGDSGAAIVPGKPAESLLIEALQPGADPHMPPKGQLTGDEIALIGDWIESLGAPGQVGAEPTENWIPNGIAPTLAIDIALAKDWHQNGIPAPARCDDQTFLRRVYLDLLGRIPTAGERETFLADTGSDKRERLTSRLLESGAHARHFAEVLTHALLGRDKPKRSRRAEREQHLLPYLRWAIANNRPWDQIARDLVIARPEEPETRGASWFLYEQGDDPNKMATATSAALLGKQVQCAQCHDHPVAPEIGQRHYHALVGFFSRTRNVQTPDGPALGEAAAGGYAQFANLEGETSEMQLEFLTGQIVAEPEGKREKDDVAFYVNAPPGDWINPPKPDPKTKKVKLTTKVEHVPVPKFSRRAELARIAFADNPEFASAFVNRVWALLLGRGIVHPVDKMDSAHPPSHPDLLAWLAEDFANSGYDIRRLTNAVIGSLAYQASAANDGSRPMPDRFATAPDKPLAAELLYRSMLVALGAQPSTDGTIPDEATHRATFARALPASLGGFVLPTVQYAMFVANSPHLEKLLSDPELPLVSELAAIDNPDEATRLAFVRILGREPDSEERQAASRHLAERAERRPAAVRDLIWALLAGAEFHTTP